MHTFNIKSHRTSQVEKVNNTDFQEYLIILVPEIICEIQESNM